MHLKKKKKLLTHSALWCTGVEKLLTHSALWWTCVAKC